MVELRSGSISWHAKEPLGDAPLGGVEGDGTAVVDAPLGEDDSGRLPCGNAPVDTIGLSKSEVPLRCLRVHKSLNDASDPLLVN